MLTKLLTLSLPALSSAQILSDWQYVQRIHSSLKKNNLNEAMTLVINSYLNKVVLDRQTYYNFYLKMEELKAGLSYKEVAYKLYRQSFSPHLLMEDWMKRLVESDNQKVLELIKQDFKALNIEMPKKIETKPQAQPKPIISIQPKATKASQSPKQPSTEPYIQNFPLKQFDTEITKLVKENGVKIILHNLEIEMNNQFEEFSDEEKLSIVDEKEEEVSEEEQLNRIIDLIDSAKIKVEKIQIVINKKKPQL